MSEEPKETNKLMGETDPKANCHDCNYGHPKKAM